MNSKYRSLSKFCHWSLLKTTNRPRPKLVYVNELRLLQSGPRCPEKFNASPLGKLNWTTQCGCFSRSCCPPNSSVLSSSVINRCYVTTPAQNLPPPTGNEEPEKRPSLYQRFKTMYRDYWYVLLPVHLVTSAVWFGSFYYMASSGVDIVGLLENLNVNEKLINPFRNGHATTGYLAISYALYKIATPVRYTVTLGGTTISINYLMKRGYIKPLPSKEKLKEIYEDKKEILKGKGQTIKDNMLHTFKPAESKKKNP